MTAMTRDQIMTDQPAKPIRDEHWHPSDAFDRCTELSMRESLARCAPEAGSEPLTVAEHLELLAAGEAVARYVRHPTRVDHALKAGASWADIAKALDTDENKVRAAYRQWADGQHHLHQTTDGKLGIDADEHAAAVARAKQEGQ